MQYYEGVDVTVPVFEWDPVKAESNEFKHDITFEEAAYVFRDPHVVFLESTRPEHGL